MDMAYYAYIKKATTGEATMVAEMVSKLLADFIERSGSNFDIDINNLTKTTTLLLTRENYAAFVAYCSDHFPIGLLTISLGSAIYNGGDFGVINELYVVPQRRSEGVGNHLLKEAKIFAAAQGWKKIEVGAPDAAAWPRTIDFYKRNGFKEKGPKLRIDL